MTKHKVDILFRDYLDVEGPLSSVISSLQKLQNSLPEECRKDAHIASYPDPYSDRDYLGLYITRLETDEEYEKRLESQNRYEESQRELYEKLKAKYEGDKK